MFVLKPQLLFVSLFLCTFTCTAVEDIFQNLPYNIILGKTRLSELEVGTKCNDIAYLAEKKRKRRSLERWKPFSPNTTISDIDVTRPCREYSINNKFDAYTSDNGIIQKLEFMPNHLPRKWRNAGLQEGLSVQETETILGKAGVKKFDKRDEKSVRLKFFNNSKLYIFEYSDGLYSIVVEPDY